MTPIRLRDKFYGSGRLEISKSPAIMTIALSGGATASVPRCTRPHGECASTAPDLLARYIGSTTSLRRFRRLRRRLQALMPAFDIPHGRIAM